MGIDNVNEVYVEKVHSRKSKTNFKGVVQKMLISSLVLTTVLGTSAGAFAAEAPKMDMSKVQTVAYENNISVDTALREIRTTVAKLKIQISQGSVQTASLEKLASQLNQLEKAANGKSTTQIVSTLNNVENAVKGVSGNEQVMVALQSVRDSLGITSLTEDVKAPKTKADGAAFGDVPSDKWYYNSVMAMSGQGLLKGTGDVDGVPQFAPNATMTRAAYITIAVRVAYQSELDAKNKENPNQANWWDNAWNVAIEKGIIDPNDPDMNSSPEDMNGTIRREEMALILQRTAHAKSIATTDWVYQTQIPDFKEVSPYYRDSVRECYTLGMLNGIDGAGTFNPQGTLDRASASQSFYKLLNADKRTPVTPQKPAYNQTGSSEDLYKPVAGVQTWTEGESHTIPKEGDIVVKADGTQVTLKMNQVGNSDLYLLGFGQGVDIITGTRANPNANGTWGVGCSAWYSDDRTIFVKYDVTGEVYTSQQWSHIDKALCPDKNVVKGSVDGEKYGDYFHWNAFLGEWVFDVKN